MTVSLNYIKQLGLKDTLSIRCRQAEMAYSIIATLVSPLRSTTGGGPYVELFYGCLPLGVMGQNEKGYLKQKS